MAKGMYVGVTEEEKIIAFTSHPVPTSWTKNSDGLSATASNEYGEWRIKSTTYDGQDSVDEAFDSSTSTFWQSSSSKTVNYVTLNCPTDITIKPTEITIKYKDFANLSAIEGQRSSGEWINLATLERKTSETTTTFNIDTGEYYKAIRIVANQISSSYAYQYLYDFKINSGTIKIASKINKARKVKKAYVGVANAARKVKKGYIGVNGVARLFYSAETLVPFTTCPFPNFSTDTATNDYGTWSASSTGISGTSYQAHDAFDADTKTSWRSKDLASPTTYATVQLTFPTGVFINPTKITVSCMQFVRCLVQGFNSETNAWEDIGEATSPAYTLTTTNLTYSGSVYFSAIRAYGARYSASYDRPEVADLKITSGTIKLEG